MIANNFAQSYPDPSTRSNYLDYATQSVAMDWTIDFTGQKLVGSVTLGMKRLGSERVVKLDASHLQVDSVSVEGQAVDFSLEGGCLSFECHGLLESFAVKINYETTSDCSALQWLTPKQTVGGEDPFLFSQCQAIHARTLLPCQDTPAIKAPFTATVRSALPVIMSANRRRVHAASPLAVYEFEQTMAIPAYLIAIAAGYLASKPLGPRCAVWAEPERLEAAAWEFEPTERFLQTAEELAGPYLWERYEVLVLPPSFPYGGMENPCLTFLTPSLLAGDRSLVDVVAHEIAHSWTGNLVSCVSWEHFWLNEGFTMFLERKIMARLGGGEALRHFDAQLGWIELRGDVEFFGPQSPATCLCPDLRQGADPDDYFSRVPYEKGHTLLFYLEGLLGGPAIFERYLRAHLDHFAGLSIDTAQWLEYLTAWYQRHHSEYLEALQGVDWQAWLKGPGMPPCTPTFDQTLMEPCRQLAKAWHAHDYSAIGKYFDFIPAQKCMFLDLLTAAEGVDVDRLAKEYQLLTETNVEICLLWFTLALKTKYEPAYQAAAAFACQHGRMKYCRPIYRLLFTVAPQMALSTFIENRAFYHPIAATMIAKDLQIK